MADSQDTTGLDKPAQTKPPVRKRRTRRSTGEIITRIVAAAIAEFEENGYSGARTATISQRAGVVEALIFNHFGSKQNLFERAIFARLDQHHTAFVNEHRFNPGDRESRLRESREFIGAQQDFLRRNDRMFKSLVVSETNGVNESEEVPRLSGLQNYLDKMVGIVESRPDSRGEDRIELTARISFATILACALFGDWLFPEGIADDAEIRTAVTDFVMQGARDIL